MVAQSSRSARGGGGGATTTSGGKGAAGSSNRGGTSHTNAGGGPRGGVGGAKNSDGDDDDDDAKRQPKLLLARGCTSRLLPPTGSLQALAPDEVEKDLRHFQAYHRAVLTYRQQYYLAVNPNHIPPPLAPSGSTSLLASPPGSSSAATPLAASASSGPSYLHPGPVVVVSSLPVRIDPEEEKRLALLRRKIARAEWLREDLEQRYVALRAHYVQASHEVRHVQSQVEARQEFLRTCVRERAATLGLMRARLQMTRDVLAALQRRGHVLAQAAATTAETSTTTTTTAADSGAASGSKDPPLLEGVWGQVEEELKKQQRKLGNPRTARAVPWPCTRMPPTPFGVPILLSNASDAPERTVAFGANGIFGSDQRSSLVWTLPETVPLDDDSAGGPARRGASSSSSAAAAAVVTSHRRQELDALNEEVAILQAELGRERAQSQEISDRIARARSKNDEWVAMICLVRQETEAVLHRHNVVLESDAAREASERWFAHDQDSKKQRLRDSASAATAAAAAAQNSSSAPGDGAGPEALDVQVREVEVPLASVGEGEAEDEDNDGDDEGSEEEDPQDRDGPSMEDDDNAGDEAGKDERGEAMTNPKSSNKRAAHKGEAADLEDARKKRRIV